MIASPKNTPATVPEPLAALRTEIDAIDRKLLALLEERMQVVAKVGAWKKEQGVGCPIRPGREAEMVRALMQQCEGKKFFPQAAGAIWRLIIGASTNVETPLIVSVLLADKDYDLFWLAREYFGPYTTINLHPNVKRVIGDVQDGKASVGIVPMLRSSDTLHWWRDMLDSHRPLKVFALAPFTGKASRGNDRLAGLAIGEVPPEPSGDDRSLWMIEADFNVSQSRLQTAFVAAKLDATWLTVASPMPEVRQHVVNIGGFVDTEHAGFKEMISSLGKAVHHIHWLGSYAVPVESKVQEPPSEAA